MKKEFESLKEEFANSLTHGVGFLLSLVGVPFLVYYGWQHPGTSMIWAVSIYSFSLLMVYSFSTLYHSFRDPDVKRVLRILDHVSIFFLIAGTYTPFIFLYLNYTTGYMWLAVLWGIAITGSILKIFFTGRFELISTFLYLGMGWLVIFIGEPIFNGLSFDGMLWFFVGGAAYTLGIIFFMWEKLRFNHAIWHLFVLTGSVSHYIAILFSIGVGSGIPS